MDTFALWKNNYVKNLYSSRMSWLTIEQNTHTHTHFTWAYASVKAWQNRNKINDHFFSISTVLAIRVQQRPTQILSKLFQTHGLVHMKRKMAFLVRKADVFKVVVDEQYVLVQYFQVFCDHFQVVPAFVQVQFLAEWKAAFDSVFVEHVFCIAAYNDPIDVIPFSQKKQIIRERMTVQAWESKTLGSWPWTWLLEQNQKTL